jgi:hypothetical protein
MELLDNVARLIGQTIIYIMLALPLLALKVEELLLFILQRKAEAQ